MALRDIIEQLIGRSREAAARSQADFSSTSDSDGINFIVTDGEMSEIEAGDASIGPLAKFVALQMLEEEGLAERLPHGFNLSASAVTRCDQSIADVLELPPPFSGILQVHFDSYTASNKFRAYVTAQSDAQEVRVSARGGLIQIGRDCHRANHTQWSVLEAIAEHSGLADVDRNENSNVQLVGSLLRAAKADATIHVRQFSAGGWTVSQPSKVGVRGAMDVNGDLVLSPLLDEQTNPALLERRWGQLSANATRGVLRVDKHLIALDSDAMAGVREVLQNRRIPADQVSTFLKAPSAFLNAALVDLDLGFSVRVDGIGVVRHIDFDGTTASEIDWFDDQAALSPPTVLKELLRSLEDIEAFEFAYEAARCHDATAMTFSDRTIDISSPEEVEGEVVAARQRLTEPTPVERTAVSSSVPKATVSLLINEAGETDSGLRRKADSAPLRGQLDLSRLARTPFPHQVDGIEWIARLAAAAHVEDQTDLYRLQGSMLADDMGLGKTFMALAAIDHHNQWVSAQEGHLKVRPTLIVAPLTLLENWEAEIEKSFAATPFADVVVLQSDRDLPRFRKVGHSRETTQLAALLDDDEKIQQDQVRLALRVGAAEGPSRLDMPARLVLTTYETLRDYQLSMAQIDWGIVVFDEAQAIKNPNTMRTRAAKGLRATFKLIATGTPVENSLGDFWCLVDTAQPGLLGDWQTFRDEWITPTLVASGDERSAIRIERGRALRDAVGSFMLRRIKEDHLDGLPAKLVHSPFGDSAGVDALAIAQTMPAQQQSAYDAILAERLRDPGAPANNPLAVLTRLRAVSLHPELGPYGARPAPPASRDEASRQVAQSGKLVGLINILDGVRARKEKAIIFAMSKDLQLLVTLWIRQTYGVHPHIINGDTAATSKSNRPSRRRLIEEFESVAGFGVIVMSPIAAGTGLTVVGANHVIHLERHWNPAKEAQATDRAYRIGQEKDVHVYYPASIHPDRESFDVLIDRLLAQKVSVKDAVMEQGELREEELSVAFGFTSP